MRSTTDENEVEEVKRLKKSHEELEISLRLKTEELNVARSKLEEDTSQIESYKCFMEDMKKRRG